MTRRHTASAAAPRQTWASGLRARIGERGLCVRDPPSGVALKGSGVDAALGARDGSGGGAGLRWQPSFARCNRPRAPPTTTCVPAPLRDAWATPAPRNSVVSTYQACLRIIPLLPFAPTARPTHATVADPPEWPMWTRMTCTGDKRLFEPSADKSHLSRAGIEVVRCSPRLHAVRK